MTKKIALVAVLALALMGSVASAQAVTGGKAGRPLAKIVTKVFQARIQHGVRSGEITQDELAQLRTHAQALRAQVQALRQAGQRPTPAQRQEVRQALKNLRQEIYTDVHNDAKNAK